ncbi:ATP-binding cassette sub-family C member Sur [Drosophila guanche]|uniref:Blast:ATP-binding cassette sub-family C member Sur n=1 Tax=Drosophila guanche TaxID=7266 RepID=A0A3B0JU22_DROGU|nr:ATP-binding cassette sub-family C member Sur [Drosophila guanche]SPP85605.1 blast:ATP-binding cassette sub-family C member Sur [Drosophila guanche]
MTQLFNVIHCNHLNGRVRTIYENLDTDVCGIVRVKLLVTCLSILLLLFACAFVWKKYENCNATLSMFHNLRAAVSLLMLAGNSLDLAGSLLPPRSVRQLSQLFELTNRGPNFLVIIGAAETWNALASTTFTVLLMCYHRVIERKKLTVFLYASIVCEVLALAVHCHELTEVAYYEDLLELQTCLVGMSAVCLLLLASLDGYTLYNEHFRDNYVDDPEKIGYKHSFATFYSKSSFWWLTPLLWLGYKEPLELEDLGAMKLEDSARSHYDHFLYIYTDEVKKSNSSPSLWYCYVKNSWRMFALGGIFKLAADLFALVGPLAIQQIVQYIEELYAQTTHPSVQSAGKHESGFHALMLGSNVSADADDDIFGTNIDRVRIYYATWSELLTNGWSIAWIVLLAALTQGSLSQASTHILNMTGIWIKTSLQGLIYRKTLLLNASSGCSDNNGIARTASASTYTTLKTDAKDKMNTDDSAKEKPTQGNVEFNGDSNPSYDIGSITNHMTEDTLNIMQFFWIAHYAWAIPFKISVIIYLLYLKLGISAVIGAIVCILIMTPLQFLIGNAMSKNSEVIAKYTDERLKKIHDTLMGIRVIKLNAWDEVFFKKIQVARKKELKYLNKDALFWTLMTILTHISTVLITFATLGVYVWLPQEANFNLNASRLFSALALFQQLTVPLLIFPITVPIIIAARVSTRRLERFFEANEIQKQFEGIRNMARILSKSDASLDMYETQEKSNMTMRTAQAENLLSEKHFAQRIPKIEPPIEENSLPTAKTHPPQNRDEQQQYLGAISASFLQEVGHQKLVQQRRELLRNTPYVAIRPPKLRGSLVEKNQEFCVMRSRNTDSWRRDSLLLKMPDDIAVSINDGLFTWHPESQMPMVQLHIQGVVIPKGKLTIVVGKNGSGKTSLLSALLMEMPLLAGNMFWHKTCTISYVSQQPWLLNDTIRENILFGESFRPSRYDFVLEACALKPDIEIMPKGDLTIIGERGINLSGGQIQRIAIARSIYSSANVVIMDDPLSSLDNEVGDHIFQRCVRHMLQKSNRTFILVTQQLQLIKEADYVIVMKEGRLEACGSYAEIESKHPQITAKWKSIIAQNAAKAKKENDAQNHVERTAACERWKLLKNVSKLGLQRSISVTIDENGGSNTEGPSVDDSASLSVCNMHEMQDDIEEYEEDNETPAPYLQRKRSSVYGSRHLLYDLPLPIDECQADDVIMRPRRRQVLNRRVGRTTNSWHRLSGLSTLTATSASSSNSGTPLPRSGSSNTESSADGIELVMPTLSPDPRIRSWQPKKNLQHQALARNASSPPAIDMPQITDTKPEATPEDQVRGSFQLFLRRMSMRRSNKPKHHHQPLSATNSILSISEESAATCAFPTADRGSLLSSSVCTYNAEANDVEGKVDNPLTLIKSNEKGVNIDCKDGASFRGSQCNISNISQELSTDVEVSNVTSLTPVQDESNMEVQYAGTENELLPMSESANDAERKYGKISPHIYLMYIRACGVPIITAFFITALIWQCLRVYTDVWLQHWSDVHIQAREDVQKEEGHEVTYYFCMYTAISCVCIIMAMISTPAGQWAGCNARRNLHDKLLQSILHKTLHFFQVTSPGRIVNRFSNDMAIIDKKIAATCQRLLQFSLLCISAIVINVSITPWFLASTLPICAAYYIIQKFYRCSARELQRIENLTNSPVISHLSETIQGVTTIRAYNQQARFTEILFKRLEANTIAFALLNTSHRWLGISLDYLGGCIVFLAIVTSLATASFSCSKHRYARDVAETYANNKSMPEDFTSELSPTPSLVGLAINYTLLVPIYLNWVVKLLADMEMYAGSVERIAHYAKGQDSDLEANEEISNEVDRSSSAMWTAGDKVCPSATTAAVDVDEDGGNAGDGENADKLNAGNATGDGNHLNFHFHTATATAADKIQKATTQTSVIRDKKLPPPPHSGKVDLPNEPARRRLSCQLKRYQSVPISWPQRGDISFENVSLRYEGQTQNVISGLTLKIPAGQRLGICGRTGCGKSSLGLSLFGVLQVTSGHIRIDEMDIKQIRPEELRTRLSIIPQDVHLFNTTIRENLDPHGYYSDLQLWNCLELAQLKEFVKVNLPLGLSTVIIDGAINLSAGQRQLLCLARAILRGSVCLVLDEATSALDSTTEAALLRAADKAFQGRTIITIAHRLTTILEYDRIVVMESGRIIEDGNPRTLQQLPGSAFQRLLEKRSARS